MTDSAYSIHEQGWTTREDLGAAGLFSDGGHAHSVAELYERHHHVLWEESFHKYCVAGFLRELDTILRSERFRDFPQERLDFLIGELRRRGNSNGTINRKLSALSKLLKKARQMGEVHSLPEIRRLKERAGRIRFLDYDEEARLFSSIRVRSETYANLSLFLVDTGARLGEAIGARWNDIEEGRVTFWLTKSGRSRTVPLTHRAQRALQAQRGRAIGPFIDVKQYQFRIAWHQAKAEVGLGRDADVVPHVLRHTCASRLVRGGVDIRRVQTWLGHQTLQMTMRYAHLATHDLDACLSVLEER
ncbi:tyrosine-type recombinase/integrase [Mesorhizobium australicum]|uniref:tyrosine-type recombinase/integrase n=1 Tax=Mesorhizobium australicum TaxID=536018 RepID=UPI001FCCCF2D|nr:site-specific integrase [Mesorhizobium australicum]